MTISHSDTSNREGVAILAHLIMLVLGLIGAVYFFIQLINAWDVANAQHDQHDTAGWFIGLGVVALMCAWVVGGVYAEKTYSPFCGWSLGLGAGALFLAGVWFWEVSISNQLHTKDGYFRIMDGGEILTSGQTAVGPRSRTISRVIETSISEPVRLTVETENGASLEVFMTVQVSLANHPTLAGVFVRGDTNNEELRRALNIYFEPFLRLLVRDIEEGRVSALDTAMLVRLGELMRARPDRVPEWARDIQVSDFRVVRARQAG